MIMPNRIPRALKSSLAGKHKQKNGARFESALQTAFQFVGNVFGDIVEKTPEPLRVLRRGNGNTLTAFFAKKAQPDFKGALKSQGGRAFVAEAKSTEGKAISFALVKSHQMLALSRYAGTGAAVAVIVGIGGKIFLIPFAKWRLLPSTLGKRSATAQDLAPYEWHFEKGIPKF